MTWIDSFVRGATFEKNKIKLRWQLFVQTLIPDLIDIFQVVLEMKCTDGERQAQPQ
jgi:hypothetical protein